MVADNPNVMRGVVGTIQMKIQPVIADFFASRLGMPGDALVPTMLAAATLGVVQAAHTQWFIHCGDLATTMSESLAVLERGISTDPKTWAAAGDLPNFEAHVVVQAAFTDFSRCVVAARPPSEPPPSSSRRRSASAASTPRSISGPVFGTGPAGQTRFHVGR